MALLQTGLERAFQGYGEGVKGWKVGWVCGALLLHINWMGLGPESLIRDNGCDMGSAEAESSSER